MGVGGENLGKEREGRGRRGEGGTPQYIIFVQHDMTNESKSFR